MYKIKFLQLQKYSEIIACFEKLTSKISKREFIIVMYTQYPEKIGTPKYLRKYKFYKKVFQIRYRVQNDLFTDFISTLILSGVANVRLSSH